MLVTIDKRGSIRLPASLRKDLGLGPGSHLELTIEPGDAITLYPVEVHRKIQLNEAGLSRLKEARDSGIDTFPEWFDQELSNTITDTD